MKNWEVCPLCEGSGQKKDGLLTFNVTPSKTPQELMDEFKEHGWSIHNVNENNNCQACNGKRIISSITGLPPKTEQ